VKECEVDDYLIKLLTDVICGGIIQCPHVLIAYKKGSTEPCYAIASEASTLVSYFTYYIGAYPGYGHMNYGSAIEFGELDVFEKLAVELMEKALNVKIIWK
jgi:hypothetical protein